MKKHFAIAAAFACLASGCTAHAGSQNGNASTRGELTIEKLIDIRHPSGAMWSPDGRSVVFVWDRAGLSKVFVVPGDASTAPRELTEAGSSLAGAFFSSDGRSLLVPRNGDLWRVPLDGRPASAVWTTPAPETSIVPSPDRQKVAFVRSGHELWVRSLDGGSESRVAVDATGIGNVGWSPDARYIGFVAGSHAIRHEQTPSYSGVKIIYTITENVPGQAFVVAASGGQPRPLDVSGGGGPSGGSRSAFATRRWIDGTHIVSDRTSPDFKRRTISIADITAPRTTSPTVLHEDVEDKFWSMTGDAGATAQPSPDRKRITFLSDRDGWDHIYVSGVSPNSAVQITKGRFEAWRPQWSPDGTRIAFDANEPDHYGDRHLYVATMTASADGAPRATIAAITSGRGTDIAPSWSPDGTRLLYQHTDPHNSADLWVVDAKPGATPVRLTTSMPASIDRAAMVEPEVVHYRGPDGKQVPAWLFVPKNLDRSRKHPAIVWIHGDGINQNYDGWHVQRNYAVYYSFHQYLLQKGYVVIAPDYRGSIGYGREWREGVYMDVGGKDAKDAWMAANYLKTLPYVDGDRLGVWGLSYGGFFTLIAVTDQPKLFRAAVDVAGVVDYAMYYEDPYHGGWTRSRIGTPEEHPDVYANASPLSHVDRLERPLLILHGTSDVNVPYLHSVRLIDELMKKGKGDLVSFMSYPGEFHYFTREHVLRDAWHRVEDFFDEHLKARVERRTTNEQP